MAQCPFCKSTIDDELARFGGHCPKCVIEIPGDETPTDPGIGKRAEEQVETERQRRWGMLAAVAALVLVVLLGAGSVLWWRIDQQSQAALQAQLEAEAEFDFYIAPSDAHELPSKEPEQPEQAAVASAGGGTSRRTYTEIPSSGGSSSKSKTYDFIGTSDAGEPELANLNERKVEVGSGGTDFGSVGLSVPRIDIQRGGVSSLALSDPEEIRLSVGTALKAYSKQMTACYERRLKNTPDLRGTWDVSFTILSTGRTSNIAVIPQSTRDTELEGCMKQAVALWTFQPLVSSKDVAKAYKFGPAE